mgnify:CR=1 FL=1
MFLYENYTYFLTIILTFLTPNTLNETKTIRATPVTDNMDPIMRAFDASLVPSSNIPISGRL